MIVSALHRVSGRCCAHPACTREAAWRGSVVASSANKVRRVSVTLPLPALCHEHAMAAVYCGTLPPEVADQIRCALAGTGAAPSQTEYEVALEAA